MAKSNKGSVTRVDVAKLAGVAEGTVSRVLRGHANVAPELTARVMKAVVELGYQPNLVASGLRGNSTMQLGMIIPSLNNPFYAAVAEGVEAEAADHGYSLVIAVSAKDSERPIRTLTGRRVDAVVNCDGNVTHVASRPLLDRGIPWITCGFTCHFNTPRPLPHVVSDTSAGAAAAVRHVLDLGHRRIALVPGHVPGERLTGWLRALSEAGLEPVCVAPGRYTYETGMEAAGKVIESGATAVVVGNDIMALAVINRAVRSGLRVPADLSVVGYDDIWLADNSTPPLTTIRTDPKAMGAAAVKLAVNELGGGIAESVRTGVGLVVRESTAAVAQSA